ncbi:uncharacterized [Tachysurus ichikawai]
MFCFVTLPAPCRVLMTSELWLLSRCRAELVRFYAKEHLGNRQRFRLYIASEGERPVRFIVVGNEADQFGSEKLSSCAAERRKHRY